MNRTEEVTKSSSEITVTVSGTTEKGSQKRKSLTLSVWEEEMSRGTDWVSIYAISFVAFLMGIQGSVLNNAFWPYLKQLDVGATESFFGYIMAANNIGHAISSPLVGWGSNKINKVKILMVAGKCISILGCILYITMESFRENQRIVLLFVQLLFGLAGGFLGLLRTVLATASSETDRSKAISISSFAAGIGFMTGPAFQLLFTLLDYPGLSLLPHWHLNIYTAPIYVALAANSMGIVALVFWFRDVYTERDIGEMTELTAKEEKVSQSTRTRFPFDVVAVVVCIVMRLYIGASQVGLGTIEVPMTMVVFGWTNQSAVFYNSIVSFVTGGLGLIVNLSYIFTPYLKRIPERIMCMTCIFCVSLFYLLTFPWPFLGAKIPFHKNISTTLSTDDVTVGTSAPPSGCDRFTWCEDTPAINVYVYVVAYSLLNGVVIPLSMISLDTLFSKVLGNIKQGFMQGVFICSGDFVNTIGPIVIMALFSSSGTRYVWIIFISLGISILFLWAIAYRRMIPRSERVRNLREAKKADGDTA